jgi:hypothetical protein
VEVAGHDPAAVLRDAVGARGFEGAKSAAQVLHGRITSTLAGEMTPNLATYGDLIPAGLPEATRERLTTLADAADDRRRELGERIAADPPQWAREALGPVPDDAVERAEWESRASWAAAYRELAGRDDDADALGAAPPAGLAEAHAAWRAAHGALDLPDAGADEAEMSDGALRARERAFEREETWAPRYVADDLAAAERRAEQARVDAQVWVARAGAATDPTEAAQLRQAAEQARADAADAARQAADLDDADTARAEWWAHTAVTRDNAERPAPRSVPAGSTSTTPTSRSPPTTGCVPRACRRWSIKRWPPSPPRSSGCPARPPPRPSSRTSPASCWTWTGGSRTPPS